MLRLQDNSNPRFKIPEESSSFSSSIFSDYEDEDEHEEDFSLANFLLISRWRQIISADPQPLRQLILMKEFTWAL